MPPPNPTPDKRRVVVYLTGFGPFRTHAVNSSWSIVSSFLPSTTIETEHAIITLLPHPEPVKVAYATVTSLIPPLHASNSFSYILHVGLGPEDRYQLEKLAHEGGYVSGDVDGLLPDGTRADPERDAEDPPGDGGDDDGGRSTWGCKLDVEWICQHLEKFEPEETPGLDVPVNTSEVAGRFLCEFIYLTSLKAAVRAEGGDGRRSEKVLFMHVPPLGKPFGVETGRKVLVEVVKGMVRAGEERRVVE